MHSRHGDVRVPDPASAAGGCGIPAFYTATGVPESCNSAQFLGHLPVVMTAPTVVLDQDVDTRNKLSVPWLTNVLFGHGQYVPISDNGDDRRERDQWDAKGVR